MEEVTREEVTMEEVTMGVTMVVIVKITRVCKERVKGFLIRL